jgi:hypothetical protein
VASNQLGIRNSGIRGFRGAKGLEVTRAHVETSPLWRLINWELGIQGLEGIEVFSTEKPFRVVS